MKTMILLLGIGLALLSAGCGRSDEKAPATRPAAPAPAKSEPSESRVRSVPTSSDGALEILGIHPVSATVQAHPTHLLRVSCTFDHPLEGDVVARFLDARGKERGRSQQHIKTEGSRSDLEFKVAASIPIDEIASVHLKLPE